MHDKVFNLGALKALITYSVVRGDREAGLGDDPEIASIQLDYRGRWIEVDPGREQRLFNAIADAISVDEMLEAAEDWDD